MHAAPDEASKVLFLKSGRIAVYGLGAVSTVCLLGGNFIFVSSNAAFWLYGIVVLVIAFYLALTYLVGFAGRDFDLNRHQLLVAKWLDRCSDASVDIYLPICGESPEVILNTWRFVQLLARAHDNIKVFVLDDRPSAMMEGQATSMGFRYITRHTNELKKAGNLRNAFGQTSGEFIAIFDADFCPRRDFLIETLCYMFEDPKCAIVQTPQFFSDRKENNWLENAAGAVQELFYRLIQVNRDTFGGSICVGTNAIYRRKALEPFGGTAPMAYSEDVHTGWAILTSGWALKYIPVVLAEGICPDSMAAFFTQQYRWSMGSISLFFSKKFWQSRVSKMQRVSYLTGMGYYMATGIAVVTQAVPTLAMLLFFPEKIFWYNLLFSVPSLVYSVLFMRLWMKLPMTLDVLRVRQIAYYAHFYALRDFLIGSLEEWKATGSVSSSNRFERFRVLIAFNFIATIVLPMWLIGHRLEQGFRLQNFSLMIGFLFFNLWITWPILMRSLHSRANR